MIHDITAPVPERLAVWPGDPPPAREVLWAIERGDNITLSTLHATVHLGAHADAPNHYGHPAPGIDARALDYYLGPCQVVRVPTPPRTRISPDRLTLPPRAPRLLIATDSFADPHTF